jgi:sec-independent protein translocase protein TatA
MPHVTPQEVILVIVLALLLFGPKKLPELSRSIGESIREFRHSVSGQTQAETPATPAPVLSTSATTSAPASAPVITAPATPSQDAQLPKS